MSVSLERKKSRKSTPMYVEASEAECYLIFVGALPEIGKNIMSNLSLNEQQLQKMKTQPGFIAALDQSGGSTPKALAAYGIKEGAWSNETEMFAIVHQMRARIITSPSFTGERI